MQSSAYQGANTRGGLTIHDVSPNADVERTKAQNMLQNSIFTLPVAAGSYDRMKDHFLVARDGKTDAEAWRAPLRSI